MLCTTQCVYIGVCPWVYRGVSMGRRYEVLGEGLLVQKCLLANLSTRYIVLYVYRCKFLSD